MAENLNKIGLSTNHRNPYIRSEACLFGSHTGVAKKGWICGRHVHHMMIEFNLVLSGKQRTTIGGVEYVQEEGDLLVVPPMQLHDFRVDDSEEMHYFCMHVQLPDPYFIELLERENKGLYRTGHPINEALVPHIRKMAQLLSGELNSRIELFAELYAIAWELEQRLSQQQRGKDYEWKPSLPYLIAKEIEKLVLVNGGDNVAKGAGAREKRSADDADTDSDSEYNWLERIAGKLGISRRHGYRVFRIAYGMSPREYLMVLKRQEAMQMLAASTDTIESIAFRIGYENVQSFSRQFVEWTGRTPGEFRKHERDTVRHLTPLEV
ncbi:AraC family transcriptional regulator [Paenibacillus sp. NEAU-GSW1]|uniref:AraC family transcriptional regulator n=1 Tax=Paenibacillus sp. NEAU-GSW1 TaxID=2682486 RepID=UPI00156768E1